MEAVRYFYNPFEPKLNDQQKFIEILHHDNRDGFAFRLQKSHKKITQFGTKEIKLLEKYDKESDIWISLNTFSKPKRYAKNIRSINCIYFDLDCHDQNQVYVDNCIKNTQKILTQAFELGILPKPTMITGTGRGYGLFYVLNKSIANTVNTKKMRSYWGYIYQALSEKIKFVLSEHKYTLELDTTSVGDVSRVVRLPLTCNQHNGATCTLNSINYNADGSILYYDLSTLSKYTTEYKKNDTKNTIKERNNLKKSKIINYASFRLPFLNTRIKRLELLQEKYNSACTNKRRELMCFYYYNTAKQLYPDQAVDKLYVYNAGFEAPLELRELDNIIYVVNHNKPQFGGYEGFYKIKDKTIIQKLDLNKEEQHVTGFGQSKRAADRENKKIETKIKKDTRNKAVLADIKCSTATYKEIAVKHGISERTVKRIAASAQIRRNNVNFKNGITGSSCGAKKQKDTKVYFFNPKGTKNVKESYYGVLKQDKREVTSNKNAIILANTTQIRDKEFSLGVDSDKERESEAIGGVMRCDKSGQYYISYPYHYPEWYNDDA